jgi:methylenetetrahydrofolate dehydrogenase (NADP+)/methenyltetrahydrofolate cyclohydrolase
LCNSNEIYSIIVQLPLDNEAEIELNSIYEMIPWYKDVDGFNPTNLSRLIDCNKNEKDKFMIPCTPMGIKTLLDSINFNYSGCDAVVLGKSRIVGLPMLHLLLNSGCTVTSCHSKTKDLPSKLKTADLVIVAIGKANQIKGEWLKKGCTVIDVGINFDSEKKIVGDVDFEEAKKIAKFLTPVPGGIGQLTIAMLAKNLLKSFKQNIIHR